MLEQILAYEQVPHLMLFFHHKHLIVFVKVEVNQIVDSIVFEHKPEKMFGHLLNSFQAISMIPSHHYSLMLHMQNEVHQYVEEL
jgi:hypothetical protein